MNLLYVEKFTATISGLVSLEAVIGAIAIALFYWNRFNSWTEKEARYGKTRPPRQFTTWARFVTYATIYTLSMVGIYLLLLVSPDLFRFIGDYFGWVPGGAGGTGQGGGDFPLWVMVFLLGFYPYLPVLRQVEGDYRHWFHERAFIPAEAKALVNQLVANPSFFTPDNETIEKVIQKYGRGMPENWGREHGDNHLTSKWFRLVYLREKLEFWRSNPEIERLVEHCEEDYKRFEEQFRQLHLDVESFIEHRNGNGGQPADDALSEHLDQLKISIMRQIERLLGRAYEFVACGILSTERIHSRRTAALNDFGLFPTYEPGIPIVLDIVLKNTVIVFLIASLTSTVYIGYRQIHNGEPLRLAMGLVWAVIALMMIGLCILGAVVVYRMLTHKSRFEVEDNGDTLVIGPFVHQCIGFATGYLCGWLVIFPYLSTVTQKGFVYNLAHSLPWPLIPAITAGFIVYYLAVTPKKSSRIKTALRQAVATGLAGLIVSLWAFQDHMDKLPSFFYIISTSLFIGGAIGYFFPSAYRQRLPIIYRGSERRSNPRITIMSQAGIQSAEDFIPCEAVDISAAGARIAGACDVALGDRVQLELPGLGRFNSEVVRKAEHNISVKFQPETKQEQALLNYIGGMSFATG
ncbi:MAG: PilZ domain-containing protein [Desulfatitalea sp.]|nr:PilZ domain-containing protein [Desulfatitalea sp.]NNK02799.1 PilZ domain-containing protein [Desulfatitalea sp.]